MGKGSSKGHTPREAKDNLKSTQLLSVIDAISEGPVEGPVDGLKSVLLNSTPVLDSEGNTNISGVTVVFRAGEQEQTPPEGFESSGSETVLGTEVKYDTPTRLCRSSAIPVTIPYRLETVSVGRVLVPLPFSSKPLP